MMSDNVQHLVVFGECMLELQGPAFGALQQSYGGDTLNTAVYLARLGVPVRYATALGEDRLSTGLLERWASEGLGLELVRRIPDRMPGLYMIEVDGTGERSFSYWRDSSAARDYFAVPDTPLERALADCGGLYLSGISLAILPPAGRERLFGVMQVLRERGADVVFDNNYRPRLWPQASVALACYERAFALASIALVTADDHQALLGPDRAVSIDAAVAQARMLAPPELVIKRGAASTLVRAPDGTWTEVPTEPVARVVDTTAAGDSFAAGYLSRRRQGASAAEAARFGNRLAARVIQHRGAVIAPSLMQDLVAA